VAEPVTFQRRGNNAGRQAQRQESQPRQDEQQRQGDQPRQRGDGKSWAQWKQELNEAIEQLDYACAEARQIIYKLRPLVRPKGERSQ
jgi:hypothetical protein